MQFERCPIEYYQNCQNSLKLCEVCSAGNGKPTGKLYYKPKQELSPHPHQSFLNEFQKSVKRTKQKEKIKRRLSANREFTKKGLNHEDRIKRQIIQKTKKSGAIFGDGDFSILNAYFRAEAKLRVTKRSFGISRNEFLEGRAKGVSTWIVSVENQGTVVILTLDAYSALLALAEEALSSL